MAIPAWTSILNPSKVILPVLLGSTNFFIFSFSSALGSGTLGKLASSASFLEITSNWAWGIDPSPLASILAQTSLILASNLAGSFAISLYLSIFILNEIIILLSDLYFIGFYDVIKKIINFYLI